MISTKMNEGDSVVGLDTHGMATTEPHHNEIHTRDPRLADNARLLTEARRDRVRHEAVLREADRKIRSGLNLIRRATLRVVSS